MESRKVLSLFQIRSDRLSDREKYEELEKIKQENALLESLEAGLQGNMVYKEDLENPIYLKIVDYFKGLKEATCYLL